MHLYINGLISQYGYLPILIGCIAEGETFTLLGGIAVHEGLLPFGGVFLATMIGGIIGDQLLFWLGYRFGVKILHRFNKKKYQKFIKKAIFLIQKKPGIFVVTVRFMYGFRIIGPIIIGSCHLKPLKFFIFNIIGSALWALLFVTLGYFAGEIIMPIIHNINRNFKCVLWVIGLIILTIILRYIIQYLKHRYINNIK